MPDPAPMTILCMASFEKGHDFLRECKAQGCRVFLLTVDRLMHRKWPWEVVDQVFTVPEFTDRAGLMSVVSKIAWDNIIDRVVALDDYDVETAAAVREHMRWPGMGDTTARFYRDKLAMRAEARSLDVRVPEFVGVLSWREIAAFLERVPPPWLVKPRSEAAAVGIRKAHNPQELWHILDGLAEKKSMFLIEQFVPGRVCHVDSIIFEKEVVFAETHQYGTPPLTVAHGGGIFTSRTLPRGGALATELEALNRDVMKALRMVRGVSHTEFIKSDAGPLYFLETSARVGGAYLVNMIEASTGVNLWREWAKVEISGGKTPYLPPTKRLDHSGLCLTLARQELPDLSAYDDPEIVCPVDMHHHAGLVVASPSSERVDGLLADYCLRFSSDFLATAPPLDRAEN